MIDVFLLFLDRKVLQYCFPSIIHGLSAMEQTMTCNILSCTTIALNRCYRLQATARMLNLHLLHLSFLLTDGSPSPAGKGKEKKTTHSLINKRQFSATIKQIAGKLRDARGDVSKGLKINGLKSPEASNLSHRSTARATNATTTSYVLEPIVYGRATEIESIKNLIMSNRSDGMIVLPIVGLEG